MLGILFALGSAVAFGANAIITRRGMLRVSSNYIATLSVFTGCLFFLPVNAITGDLFELGHLSWKAYLFWALSGIIHFALGRTWAYRSIQLLGSNRSNLVTGLSPAATVALAMMILKERITPLMGFGILLSLAGPLLIILKEQTVRQSQPAAGTPGMELDRHTLLVGMLYGVGAAVFWGSSAVFIKFGFEAGGGTPVTATLISFVAAAAAISPSVLLNDKQRKELFHEDRQSLQAAISSGLTTSIAQLLKYLSIAYGSVIVVSLVARTTPLWVLFFAFLFNRKYESFSRWVFLGNGLLIIGTILVLLP
jgi:drug/metabolite transporter (DMT)-like permease